MLSTRTMLSVVVVASSLVASHFVLNRERLAAQALLDDDFKPHLEVAGAVGHKAGKVAKTRDVDTL